MGTAGSAPSGYRSSALDVRRLSLFLAVVDHGGFTRAAQAVHLSQPALSQAVAELEAELGGPLFHRLGRRVTLTEAGTALVGPARSVIRDIDFARQATGEVTGLVRGRLDLSALRTLAADPLPALLGAFRRRHPAIAVRIASPDDPEDLADQIRSGVAEVGVTDAGRVPPGLEAIALGEQRMSVVFPPGSAEPPAAVAVGDLAGIPLIVTPPGTSARDVLDRALSSQGSEATVAVETSQREAVLPLVLAGAGAAVMPDALAALAAAAGAPSAPLEPPVVRSLAVVHRPGRTTPPATAFLDVVRQRAAGG